MLTTAITDNGLYHFTDISFMSVKRTGIVLHKNALCAKTTNCGILFFSAASGTLPTEEVSSTINVVLYFTST